MIIKHITAPPGSPSSKTPEANQHQKARIKEINRVFVECALARENHESQLNATRASLEAKQIDPESDPEYLYLLADFNGLTITIENLQSPDFTE